MKSGAKGGVLNILSEDDMLRIHGAALALLQAPGIQSESDLFLDIFARGGAQVDRATRAIRVSPDMVDAALKTVPASFVLYGRRDPDMDLLIERDRVYYGMGGTSEPMIFDYDLWRPRQPTKADMVQNTRLGHALANIDFVQTLCMSGDMPTDQIFFHDFDAIFRNTTKPTVLNILERPFTQLLLGIAAAASGGEEALAAQPSMLGIVTPVSPLKIAVMNEGIIDTVQAGIPILYSPGPMMGATGPATVAGTLALTTAEVLFGVVLTQLIKPGAKVVLKPDTDVFDMKTTQCTYGSPEQNLGKMAMAQLARFYNIPIYSLGGGVEGKVPDAETASEAMMSMLLNGLAGINLNQSLGSMAFRPLRLAGAGGDLRRDRADDQARAARLRRGRRHAGRGCDPGGWLRRQLSGRRPHRAPLPQGAVLPVSLPAEDHRSMARFRVENRATRSHTIGSRRSWQRRGRCRCRRRWMRRWSRP